MIKTLQIDYECDKCGYILFTKREIVVDDYLKEIRLVKPNTCVCGRAKFKLKDINIEPKTN